MEDTVDKELDGWIGNTDCLEHCVEVVGYETISRPLGEPSESDDDRQTLAVTRCLDQGHPADSGSNSPVEIDGGLYLFVLELNKRVLLITISVIVSQDMESFGVPALAH